MAISSFASCSGRKEKCEDPNSKAMVGVCSCVGGDVLSSSVVLNVRYSISWSLSLVGNVLGGDRDGQ